MKHILSDPMIVQPVRIKKSFTETHDTYTLVLEPSNENSGFNFKPGQFNMLYLFGVGEVPISISGDSSKVKTIVHTIRACGNVTNTMRKLKYFDSVGIRGPFGNSWPMEIAKGKNVIIIGGGIGLAPLRPAIYHVLNNRKSYNRFTLLYGARTPKDILYSKELALWKGRFDMEVLVTVDHGDESWSGNVGVVTNLFKKILFEPKDSFVFMVGPEVMMRFCALELEHHGFVDKQIYLSMERNMKCGIGFCGHCQCGSTFICKDGPVYSYDKVKESLKKWEL